ncbi:MAG: glutamine-hydrolyzing GMP synthase [Gammaproteobacteria bacterium]|nr:glutamine-hydrolyzing GMP synthase [Gammaproteobacteria bacterium]
MSDIHAERILILDFGSQTTQLIARRVRDLGVYCEIYSCDVEPELIRQFNPKGIILSGGPATVTTDNTHRAPNIIFELDCPILGICYGMQTMAVQLGGEVESSTHREFGHAPIEINDTSTANNIFNNISNNTHVWMSHGDKVTRLPEGFSVSAVTQYAPIAAMSHNSKPYYGLQFHPEVTHTECGNILFSNFIFIICQCSSKWTVNNIIDDSILQIRKEVGSDQVLLGLSGGVDSSVLALLLHKAIGDQLVCVLVDNGLLRLNEVAEVVKTFKDQFAIKLIVVDAQKQFLTALKNISDPEKKRKTIGKVFIDVFVEEAKKINSNNTIKWLAQGTIYPDIIESAGSKTGKATVIKSHHNVGGLPDKLPFKLLEPFKELFKDEIRKIGEQLGLSKQIIYRHPFPGPGLAVRVLGEIKVEYLDLLRKADQIFIEILREYNWYDKTSQAFVVFMPIKSVAVLGDARSYDYVVALRAVSTHDFMSADWTQLPYELLAKASNRIINEIPGISRVVYDISSKPPATIEWE